MYKESYHGAVQSMHELQAQLDQYSNLKQSIEEAMGVQVCAIVCYQLKIV